MAAQLMATNALRLRDESRCSASATSSLPDPVGPSISTGVMRGATRRTRRLTSSMQGAFPTISGRRSAEQASAAEEVDPPRIGTVFGALATKLDPIGAARRAAKSVATNSAGRAGFGSSIFGRSILGRSTLGNPSTVRLASIAGAAFHAAVSFSWLRRSA
jgi:hypothetical protein